MNLKFLFCLFLITVFTSDNIATKAEDAIQLGTETEDIALTDDLNIARAQVQKYPDNPEAHFNLAIALSHTSLVEEAIKELRKTKLLIRKTGGTEVIDKKINEYKEIIKDKPEDISLNNIRYRLAFSHYLKAYLINKELKKTENKKTNNSFFAEKSLLLDNKNSLIKENLDLSTEHFENLLRINPHDSWAKIYYAFIIAEQMGEINKAKRLWTEVMQEEPNNPAPHFFIGELLIKEGSLKEGITEISQAILLRSLGY